MTDAIRPPARTDTKWMAEETEEERMERKRRWQEYRSCADCQLWGEEDDPPEWTVRMCRHDYNPVTRAFLFLAPEDYHCDDFERKSP